MKDPYMPGFWAAVTALTLLTAGYFYGVRELYQLAQAMHFLYAGAAIIAALALSALAWSSWQQLKVRKRQLAQGRTLVAIWNTKVALRRVETVFDRYFWGSYWQPGRTFQEVMGELEGTPLEQSLEALKRQCRELDQEVHDRRWHWLNNARELSSVATSMARERYQLDLCDSQQSSRRGGVGGAVLNRDLEVLVYTWSARLRSFDHQLDELEGEYR
ncbi:NADH:ubiquinone oxidoreductase subunit N [Pseudomonas fontis]|uniref:NADH:ubiquinone oxidoreductase subunit N n=1 Tax=Pseudomonas fontis TaxID=2942633 RepID=A0ABT5NU35_9PSED|nr:NADH:ubiquinone oxidoreductase subunit N [Pseudomonas fontis]MDD0972980.1 NADH:ubiquinone oxidoreductase subunit N [Pseudomonas fontis]MDD0991688.1 NADH:ubiquinone oxidoreductase subunit N [Pseudomonas fontis]